MGIQINKTIFQKLYFINFLSINVNISKPLGGSNNL